MKKRFFSLIGLFSFSFLLLMSCATSKNTLGFSELNGEWNIIEIEGDVVVPADHQPFPYVGFDTSTGRLYGNSGCNRMMSSITPGGTAGEIVIGAIAGTRMACKDMKLEQNVLQAMAKVKRYERIDEQKIALCDAGNQPILILAAKEGKADIAILSGEWFITTVNDEAISFNRYRQPIIAFNTEEERVNGFAGCNNFMGGYKIDEKINHSISFPSLASTMMACDSMELEGKILKALDKVRSYKQTVEGLELCDVEGKRVLTLLKK
ncbi:MAG: META domain-containing protein [Bacteroidales bacterium]|nr:META domain-containing protein [Bacteroidales bacterium]